MERSEVPAIKAVWHAFKKQWVFAALYVLVLAVGFAVPIPQDLHDSVVSPSPLTARENIKLLYMSMLEEKANGNQQHVCFALRQWPSYNESDCKKAYDDAERISSERMNYEAALAKKYGTFFFEFNNEGLAVPCDPCVLVGKRLSELPK